MARCIMCGKEGSVDIYEMQIIDLDNKEYIVCSECGEAISTASAFENDSSTANARKYIRERINNCGDTEFRNWLSDIISTKSDNYNNGNNSEENEDSGSSDTTFWISNLKAINRVVFWIILIIGIVMFFITMRASFFAAIAVLAIAIVCAILVVGLSMVFLDMASDIHKIRTILEKNERK